MKNKKQNWTIVMILIALLAINVPMAYPADKKNDEYFCIVEIDEGVKIMGTLILNSTKPEIGSKVKLEKCGIENGNYSFVMRLC